MNVYVYMEMLLDDMVEYFVDVMDILDVLLFLGIVVNDVEMLFDLGYDDDLVYGNVDEFEDVNVVEGVVVDIVVIGLDIFF